MSGGKHIYNVALKSHFQRKWKSIQWFRGGESYSEKLVKVILARQSWKVVGSWKKGGERPQHNKERERKSKCEGIQLSYGEEDHQGKRESGVRKLGGGKKASKREGNANATCFVERGLKAHYKCSGKKENVRVSVTNLFLGGEGRN